MSEIERSLGVGKISIAHPAKVRLICATKFKNDRTDAMAWAKLLHLGELPTVWTCHDEQPLRLRYLTRERQTKFSD
jgi:hypothetical protein